MEIIENQTECEFISCKGVQNGTNNWKQISNQNFQKNIKTVSVKPRNKNITPSRGISYIEPSETYFSKKNKQIFKFPI